MSKELTVVSYIENPDAFLSCLAGAIAPLGLMTPDQFIMEDNYQAAIEKDGYKNLSFCLIEGQKPKAIIYVQKIQEKLCFNHLGIQIKLVNEDKKLIAFAIDQILKLAILYSVDHTVIDDRDHLEDKLSNIGSECFNHKGKPKVKMEAVIDLTLPEEEIRGNIRKSYKSLINQGRREIKFVKVSQDHCERKLFDDFREFHKTVAGRVTRDIESWNVQFEMIKQGQAELYLGYLEPHGLVSSALFNDVGETTEYAVAVYDRNLFDYPLAHANVFEGIMSAKNRGQKFFYLGQIPAFGEVEEKEFNIGMFKKGFCKNLNTYIEWHIPVVGRSNVAF